MKTVSKYGRNDTEHLNGVTISAGVGNGIATGGTPVERR